MLSSKKDLISLYLTNFLFFLVTSFLFIPNLFQLLPSDTQPWYLLILAISVFLGLFDSKQKTFTLLIVFLAIIVFMSVRFVLDFSDSFTKFFPTIFFALFILFIKESYIHFFLQRSFWVILFHCIVGVVFYFSLPALYELIYSGRVGLEERVSSFQLRSIQFCFPEPAYAAKIFVLTGLSLILAFGREKIMQARALFLLSIFTLSLTGFIIGFIALAYSLKFKYQIYLLTICSLVALLVLNGYLALPGRLYQIQVILQTLDFNLILNDPSLQIRLAGLLNMIQEFKNFNIFGSEITNESVSFLIFSQFGFFGLIFLFFLVSLVFFRLILLDIFMVLIVLSIGYSDTFLFPPAIFFFALLLRRTAEDLMMLLANFALYKNKLDW